jgi:uncharacterized protein involved in type VI secretion and phage assembly
MIEGLIHTTARTEAPSDRRIYGIAIAQVTNNIDLSGLARVQVRFPWLPTIEPWARLGVLMAGANSGTYFIPQQGDEVVVAFNHGDLRETYVIGCLWNDQDPPPARAPIDPLNKRIIRTPEGHEIAFDRLAGSITITSNTQQKITLDRQKIVLETADPSPEVPNRPVTVTLDRQGNLSIHATKSIKLDAPTITIGGSKVEKVEIKSTSITSIDGGGNCDIKAAQVRINEPAT